MTPNTDYAALLRRWAWLETQKATRMLTDAEWAEYKQICATLERVELARAQ